MAGDNGSEPEGAKAAVDERAIARSVKVQPTDAPTTTPPGDTGILWWVSDVADTILPWGTKPKARDMELRTFWPTENMFGSALGIVCARNAAFSWNIEGTPAITAKLHDVLTGANMGEGWQDLVVKVSIDLYTQDHGAFVEIVREADSPAAPVIGINHLDAYRCWHTGFPEWPVIYQDQRNRYHLLPWYSVVTLAEMPTPVEGRPGLQYCALSRLLRACQIIKNVSVYKEEKTGGRYHGAIHLIKGVTTDEINDAMAKKTPILDQQGLLRYAPPLMVGSIDPKADVGHDTLEIATLPDGWDEEKTFKHYVTQIAMAFLSDYQEFAPLPGGGLGTSAQSEVLHMKTRGKGPGLFMKLLTHALNFKVLPQGVEFYFDEADLEAEAMEAQLRKTRAETVQIYVSSMVLDAPAARQLLLDAGDIPQEVFDQLGGTDVTPDNVNPDEEQPDPNQTSPVTNSGTPITDEEQTAGAKAFEAAYAAARGYGGTPAPAGERNVNIVLPASRVRKVVERDADGRIAAIVEEDSPT